MLDLIRRHKGIFSILFVLSGVGFVISMLGTSGGPYSGGGFLTSGYAAKVEGDKISQYEFEREIQSQLKRAEQMIQQQLQSMDPAEAEKNRGFMESLIRSQVTPDRVLDSLVQQKFRNSTATHLDLAVPNQRIQKVIAEQPYFQTDGQFDPLLYKQRVASPSLYEEYIRDAERMVLMDELFDEGLAIVSPLEEQQNNIIDKSSIFEIVEIKSKNWPNPKSISTQEATKFANDSGPDSDLNAYYKQNIAKYRQEEQIHAKHILIKDDAGGEKKAKEVLKEINDKKISFEEAAKKYSSDKSNANKGGDLNFFKRGVMDPAFEKAAFALVNDEEISKSPVKSSFGYHLIKRVAYKKASEKTFDEVKVEIAKEYLLENQKKDNATKAVDGWLKSENGPSTSELKKYNLSWSEQRPWSPADKYFPGVGNISDIDLEKLLSLSSKNKFLQKKLFKGDSWILVRYKKEAPEDKTNPSSKVNLARKKVDETQQYYLDSRLKQLEADNKIKRNEDLLKMMQARLSQPQQGR